MSSLLSEFNNGKHPVITYKYFGFSIDQKPPFTTCEEVRMNEESILYYIFKLNHSILIPYISN